MTLLRAANLRLSFGSRTVFHDLTLTIEQGERVGLVGVNGSGKSSLMRILAGATKPDTGELQMRRGATVTYLPQEPEFPEGATVASELTVAHGELRDALAAHEALSHRIGSEPEKADRLLVQLGELSDRIERLGGWDTEHQAKTLLDRLGVKEWERKVSELSGGVRKRVAIARALLTRPDMLLLDEPTNHLDADTVDWLEDALDQLEGSLLLVTHDRYFLDGLVDRIVEIQPGAGVVSYPGNYQAYLEQKLIEAEQNEIAGHKRERWIAQEVAWLRKGVEARRTKSKARIQRAQKLMAEQGPRRPKVANLQIAAAPRLGQTVVEAKHVSHQYGAQKLLDDVSVIVQRGERIGIVGRNGVGKTTFLRVLLGELPPQQGVSILGSATKIAYYDQQRAQLDPEQTVFDAAGGEEYIEVGDRRIALRDYLDDLLFPVPMQRMAVKALSGGERNRLLLAKLFLQKANLLVLDEPTNDLDIVTLNVLERLLLEFTGSVLLVTHDRYFLDKVATSILAFEGEGKVIRYPGNFSTYKTLKEQGEKQRAASSSKAAASPSPAANQAQAAAPASGKKVASKLSYKEQRELDGMEELIGKSEAKKAELEAQLNDPSTYMRAGSDVAKLSEEMQSLGTKITGLYARWQELQDRAEGK